MTATPVMLVAESGYNALTAGPENMIFDSRLKTLKEKAVVNMVANGDHYSHGLGYIPIHLYAGYLESKPTRIGWIGQNTIDNLTNVIVTSSSISNDSMSEFAADALVYIFWEQLE